MNLNILEQRLRNSLDCAERLGASTLRCQIDPPATPKEVESVEFELGCSLPSSFREVVLTISASVNFFWFAPGEFEFPLPFREIFCGCLQWDLFGLPTLDAQRRSWIEHCFPSPSDSYDRVWHHKLAFAGVGNGDMFGISIDDASDESVVYLSHDDGEGHGMRLAETFADYVDRTSQIGCVGGEDWQWLPFYDSSRRLLDPRSEIAAQWRQVFGIAPLSVPPN